MFVSLSKVEISFIAAKDKLVSSQVLEENRLIESIVAIGKRCNERGIDVFFGNRYEKNKVVD